MFVFRLPGAFLLGGILLLGGLSAQEGGIEIFAGETLFQEGTRVSLTEIYKRKSLYDGSDQVRDPLNRTFEEWRTVVGVDYGVLPDVTVSALVPFVWRSQRQNGPDLSARGLGDVALLGKYRVYDKQWKGGGFNWAMVGGIEMPTGDTDATKNTMRLPPHVQVGTGAWNPFLASAVTYEQGRFRADGVLFYKFNQGGAQDLRKGDFLFLSGRVGYRFLHVKYPGPTLGASAGLIYRHEGKDRVSGQTQRNSGSDQLHLAVGLTGHPIPAVDLFLGAEVPLYQHFDGRQLGRDIALALKFGIRF